MKNICYKVVSKFDGTKGESPWAGRPMNFSLNTKTLRRHDDVGIYAFDTIRSAKRWVGTCYHWKKYTLLKCKFEPMDGHHWQLSSGKVLCKWIEPIEIVYGVGYKNKPTITELKVGQKFVIKSGRPNQGAEVIYTNDSNLMIISGKRTGYNYATYCGKYDIVEELLTRMSDLRLPQK